MKFVLTSGISGVCLIFLLITCTTHLSAQEPLLDDEGFEIFEYNDGDTSMIMKKYFIAFLKAGPSRSQDPQKAAEIQQAHLNHMAELARQKKICIAGPFGDDGDIRGIVIYNVKSLEEAEELTSKDPAVKAGRLTIEIHPWWAAKGASLY